MNSQTFDICGFKYVLEPIPEERLETECPGYEFEVLGVPYKVGESDVQGVDLTRFGDGGRVPLGHGENFASIRDAVQFADIYERLVHFVLSSEESKESAIKRLADEVSLLRSMDTPRN